MHSRQHAGVDVLPQVRDVPESEWSRRLPVDAELGAWIVERVEDKLRVGFWIKSPVDEPVRVKRARGQHSQALRGIKQREVMSEKSGKACQQHAGLLS